MRVQDDLYAPEAPRTRRRPFLLLLVLALVAFFAGLAAMGWVLAHWPRARAEIIGEQAVAAPGAQLLTPTGEQAPGSPPVATFPAPLSPPGGIGAVAAGDLSTRVDDIERRLSSLDARATAAIDNAGRAEGLLLAVASRRALDRGAPLGYLEGLLRARFAASQPRAVAALITAARQPVTLESLASGLDQAAPALVSGPSAADWWAGVKRELAGLVVVRRADTPSPAPTDRLARARTLIEDGHVDRAMAEVNRLPGRLNAGAWMLAARRYVAARDALDLLETAALLDAKEPQAAVS